MPVVQTSLGALQGINCEYGVEKYLAFKGIPYAKPPLGELRFKAPEAPEPWKGIRDASKHGPVCPQYNERLDRMEPGSEDCLYLNVYTKTLTPNQPLPVMVWIHGGGFYTGSGNSDFYGPEFFMAQDVILVTFNYRLEVLGFLCLDNEEVPGNAGMKDQVLALKWVKNNIAAFGGDPKNITIFGCSAGSASTSYHLVSKMSEGLFNKAICQSGVCLNEWGYNLYARQRAFQLGKLLGIDTDNESELLDFLKNTPVSSLVNIQLPPLMTKHMDLADSITFGPVIEKANLKVEKFITELPPNAIKNGSVAKVPVILGYTSGEGIEIARKLSKTIGFLSIVGSIVPRELKLQWSQEKIEDADNKIRNHYFRGKELSQDMAQEVANLEKDRMFVYNIIKFARYHSRNSSVYLYEFKAETERNITKKQYKMESLDGVCHSDELPYLFNVTTVDIPLSEQSKNIIKHFTKLWCHFAKTGTPTSSGDIEQWRPYSETEQHCYIIDEKNVGIVNPSKECMDFWDHIYEGK